MVELPPRAVDRRTVCDARYEGRDRLGRQCSPTSRSPCCGRRPDEVRGLGAVAAHGPAFSYQLGDDRFDLTPERDGYWRIDLDVPAGTRYSFVLDGGEPLTDPRALRLPDGPKARRHGRLEAFDWTDPTWRGVPLPGAVVYELHVGTFTPEGTLDAAIGGSTTSSPSVSTSSR